MYDHLFSAETSLLNPKMQLFQAKKKTIILSNINGSLNIIIYFFCNPVKKIYYEEVHESCDTGGWVMSHRERIIKSRINLIRLFCSPHKSIIYFESSQHDSPLKVSTLPESKPFFMIWNSFLSKSSFNHRHQRFRQSVYIIQLSAVSCKYLVVQFISNVTY